MSLLGSELCEVYGNNFVELMKRPEKKSKKKSKKPKKTMGYTNEDTMQDSLLNNFSGEMNSLVEGFANFEKKPEPKVEIVQPEQFEEDENSEDSEDEEKVYKVKNVKKKNNTKPVVTNNKVQCEMDNMNDKINDLDVKLNLLLEKLNSQQESKKEKSNEDKSEIGNIYDLILFVIFGVFFLLVLESISKVVVKNANKLNNAPLVFNN